MSDSTNPDLVDEFAALFRAYEDVWNTQEFARLKDFWDVEDPRPMYLAEEQEDWRVGWDEVDSYWVANPGQPSFVEAILMRYRITDAKLLAPDLAQVVGWVRHDMKLVGPMKPWGGDCRITAVLRLTDEGWRFASYVEAHMTPLTYVQKLYELNVSPEFEEFRANVVAERDARKAAAGD